MKNLNPIIENYMQEKKIRLVIDKKNIILSDEKLDITKEIMQALNAKLKSIKVDIRFKDANELAILIINIYKFI